MALPEFIRRQVEPKLEAFCERCAPARYRHELRLHFKFRGNAVTLLESCPTFPVPDQWVDRPVAQFRFDPEEKTWELYCADRNGRWRWYIDSLPTHDFDALLKEVDEDPTGIFWG